MTDEGHLTEQLSKEQHLAADQVVIDLEAVLRNPHGRRTLLWILQQCGVYRSIYTGQDAATNFGLGERNVGLRLISLMERVGPTEYPQLLLDAARLLKPNDGTVDVLDAEE